MAHKRYLPNRPLPEYIFIPGVNPHPKKEGGHMEGQPDPVTLPLDKNHPEESEFLRYSLDLFNHQYFWEAHVYLESLWNAHGRQGTVADFCKALIKLSAGAVKINLKQFENAKEHYNRAQELLNDVHTQEGDIFLGFSLNEILQSIEQSLKNELKLFEINPIWK